MRNFRSARADSIRGRCEHLRVVFLPAFARGDAEAGFVELGGEQVLLVWRRVESHLDRLGRSAGTDAAVFAVR